MKERKEEKMRGREEGRKKGKRKVPKMSKWIWYTRAIFALAILKVNFNLEISAHRCKLLWGNDLSSPECLKLFLQDSTSIMLTLAALSTKSQKNNNFQLRNQKTWGFDLRCMLIIK